MCTGTALPQMNGTYRCSFIAKYSRRAIVHSHLISLGSFVLYSYMITGERDFSSLELVISLYREYRHYISKLSLRHVSCNRNMSV
jgi:hypothetical protein